MKKVFLTIKNFVVSMVDRFGHVMLDLNLRDSFMFRIVNAALGLVSAVMSVVNVITDFKALMWSTIIFAVCSFINLGLSFLGKKAFSFAKLLFKIEIVGLFTFFIISGEPEGFSPFWAPLLPACGLMMFGMAEGLILDFVMLIIVIFLCWIPAGNSLLYFDYSGSFLLRFPFLYIGYMFVGVLLSVILTHTQKAYHNLSNHDILTGALNRTGFLEYLNSASDYSDTIGFMILDLDFFKKVNDTYGHLVGDEVLCYAMNKIQSCCPNSPVCRWGGEEFAIMIPNGESTERIANDIIDSLSNDSYITKAGKEIHQTISCGAVEMPKIRFDKDYAVLEADNCLYKAKETGRNKAVYKKL